MEQAINKQLRNKVAQKKGNYQIVYQYFASDVFDSFFAKSNHSIEYAGSQDQSLKFSGDNAFSTIKHVFDITLPAKECPSKNYSLFKLRFMQAAYGNGDEMAEITQLNSSSLIALLCFYPLNDHNPIRVSFQSKGVRHELLFTDLVIEKENPVYASNRPSSIDIALYGKDIITDDSVVLLLESKFGEYFSDESKKGIGISYSDYYSRLRELKSRMNLLPNVELQASEKGCAIIGNHYCEGIKQMISHYIGATHSYELNKENRKVYLGSILFDFSELVPEASVALTDYLSCYKDLATLLNRISTEDNSGIEVIDSAFTYQAFFHEFVQEYKLDEDVADFYRL